MTICNVHRFKDDRICSDCKVEELERIIIKLETEIFDLKSLISEVKSLDNISFVSTNVKNC